MGFNLDINISAITVFLQGILSFFSPCVLPLLPVYISYFSGGAYQTNEAGEIIYPRKKIFLHTIFFVIGISISFFVIGFGFTTLAQVLQNGRNILVIVSGLLMIFFGLYRLGIFGYLLPMEKEKRIEYEGKEINPISALILGFTFSFAWTPCIGPVLSSVMLMASSDGYSMKAFLLIALFTIGFILPFLCTGLFTASLLNFFKSNKNLMQLSIKIGAVLMILMGILTLFGFSGKVSKYLGNISNPTATTDTKASDTAQTKSQEENIAQSSISSDSTTVSEASTEAEQPTTEESQAAGTSENATQESDTSTQAKVYPAPDFTLTDQYGITHKLSDYKGKTVFLNFWATWCPPCRAEMPHIQQLFENYGKNEGDVIVLGVAGPNFGNETDVAGIKNFLTENQYTFPVVMDTSGTLFTQDYGIFSFPTTFMIDDDGNIYGYVSGALSYENMDSIVQQTIRKVRN